MARTKQEILDLIPERSRNPRMAQIRRVLSEQMVDAPALTFFEAEVVAYRRRFDASEKRRVEYFARVTKSRGV